MSAGDVRPGDQYSTEVDDLEEFRENARGWLAEAAPRHGWLRQGRGRRRVAPDSTHEVLRAKQCQLALFEAGYAGLPWPREYGGQGLGIREQIAFNVEALEYDLPLGVFIIGLGMCGPTLLALGTGEQKRRYIPPLLRGEEIWCQLFSEPGAGSDVAGLRTRAIRDGDGWVVNGQKVWTSGAQRSDLGLLIARTDPYAPKHQGITMFILDMRAPGVTIRPIKQIDGSAHFNEVFLDDVRLPADSVVGEVDQGWRAAITTLMNERVSLGAVRPLEDEHPVALLVKLAHDRGRATDQAVRQQLADLWIRERLVSLIGQRITATVLMGRQPGPEGSVAKLVRSEFSRHSARLGAELAGPSSMAWPADQEGADRFAAVLLHVPGLSIAGGTDEVLRNIVGERVLGLPREPQVDRDRPFRELADADNGGGVG